MPLSLRCWQSIPASLQHSLQEQVQRLLIMLWLTDLCVSLMNFCAGLHPGFDVGDAAVDLFKRQELNFDYRHALEKNVTRLHGKGYVSLAKADHPWPCALIEHFEWVSNNLFDLEPTYFKCPMPGQCGCDGKVPTVPNPQLMSDTSHFYANYRTAWEKALCAPQPA